MLVKKVPHNCDGRNIKVFFIEITPIIWVAGAFHSITPDQRPHFEAWTRPEPETTSPNSARAQFRPDNQISRVSQDMRICGVQKNVVYGYSCKCTVLSQHDHNIGLNKHKLSLLVNANAADCNISQEKMKISGNYPRWHYRHQRNYLVYRYTHEKLVCRPSFSWNKPRIARVTKLFRAMPLHRIAC